MAASTIERAEVRTAGVTPQSDLQPLAFDRLRTLLEAIEAENPRRRAQGELPADAGLKAARQSLHAIIDYLTEVGIPTRPLSFLLADLVTLELGGRPSPLLQSRPSGGRSRDHVSKDLLRGQLAAIMQYRQEAGGLTRKEARDWVSRNMPDSLTSLIGSKPKSIDGWLTRWGGLRGAKEDAGRAGYDGLREWLAREKPDTNRLIVAMSAISEGIAGAGGI